ncbi:MAG TPA: hypothetical protein VGD14_14520 [bacterium]
MDDYEGKYNDVDLWEIMKREKIKLNISVLHDLVEKDAKIDEYQKSQNKEGCEY